MKNKAITVVVTILVIVAVSSLIFILVNSGKKDTNIKNEVIENNVAENNVTEDNVDKNDDNGENVTIDSRRGIEVLSNLDFVSKMYSNVYYDELDSYGLSNNAKVIAAFIKIITKNEYSSMLKQDEMDTYILKDDLEKVVYNTFSDTEYVVHTAVMGKDSYVAEDGKYVISSMGYTNLDFAVEIPYKITEYSDRVEVVSYRVYASTVVNTNENQEMSVTDNIFYDRAMLQKAVELKDGELSNNEENQVEFIRNLINTKSIDEKNLTSVKYTLKKDGDKLLISDYKKGI